jgi:O-acetyl-ADP-ribose deacetylase (regulator of RNase III)
MTDITATRGDITNLRVDAIVNAANSELVGGGGVDGAIHFAGGPTILEECSAWVQAHGPLPTGQAMITSGGDLPAGHVIHTVGPVFAHHDETESARLLANCYRNSLRLAKQHGCRSIAFPNISTGAFGYPKHAAGRVAVDTTRLWVDNHDELTEIVFVSFDEESERVYEALLGS